MLRIEEELILKKHKHKQLLDMFRSVLTKVSNLKLATLKVNVAANFWYPEFQFEITVFSANHTNTSLVIYDFWEVKQSQKLVDGFIKAIKTDDFEKVKAAKTRV